MSVGSCCCWKFGETCKNIDLAATALLNQAIVVVSSCLAVVVVFLTISTEYRKLIRDTKPRTDTTRGGRRAAILEYSTGRFILKYYRKRLRAYVGCQASSHKGRTPVGSSWVVVAGGLPGVDFIDFWVNLSRTLMRYLFSQCLALDDTESNRSESELRMKLSESVGCGKLRRNS